jgi:hypothetical protein
VFIEVKDSFSLSPLALCCLSNQHQHWHQHQHWRRHQSTQLLSISTALSSTINKYHYQQQHPQPL